MSKYKPKYEHDYYKVDLVGLIKKPTEEQKNRSAVIKTYNNYYEKLLSGDRSTEVLSTLDNLQDNINAEANN